MIKIDVSRGDVRVNSPYNPSFVKGARALGGKWSAPNWVFDSRDEDRVRDLCLEVYGDDGRGVVETVTLRVVFEPHAYASRDALRIAGREVARAFGRDSGAKLGEGVVVLEGGFRSGGSRANWTTQAGEDGATVLIRNMPKVAAERVIENLPDRVESANIEVEQAALNRDGLVAERERLVARLAEIDALLREE